MSEGQAVDANTFDPGMLQYGTTYYWRVDEVNLPPDTTVYKGKTWSFTAELIAYPLATEHVTATASMGAYEGDEAQDPNATCNGAGLDANDMHSTEQQAMWLGIGDPGEGFIQYELDNVYQLYDMIVWNYNEEYGEDYGAKDVNVMSSIDGQTWTQIGDTVVFNKATGNDQCIANTTVDLQNTPAKYVRLVFWSGYNEDGAYGLSEVRFTSVPTRATKPSPADASTDIALDTVLGWKAGRGALEHDVTIDIDKAAVEAGTADVHTTTQLSYAPTLLLGRTYYWRVNEVNDQAAYSPWKSDIWSFSTVEYNVIDNFEDYNDTEGDEVYAVWKDGFEIDENGSQMGNKTKPWSETTVVNSGKQSGPMYYNNTDTAVNSQISRTFSPLLNITGDGADSLIFHYRGDPVTYQKVGDYIAMCAEGADIYGNTDEFRFAYKTLTGNGSITVRVDSVQNTNVWSKGGIMIRNSLDPNAIHVTAVLAASGTAELERRTEKGGSTATTDVTNFGRPCWLKITRTGNDFTSELSKDGVNWRSFESDPNVASTVTATMGNTVYVGLVVTSHQADTTAGVTFYQPTTTGNVTGSNWTVAAIGDTDQAEGTNTLDMLYFKVQDDAGKSLTVYQPASATGQCVWTTAAIPYSDLTSAGVNLARIQKIFVGIGDSASPLNGEGKIYLDDFVFGHTLETQD